MLTLRKMKALYSIFSSKIFTLACASLLTLLFACTPSKQIKQSELEAYDTFYARYHQDSLFQIGRLAKPLGGYKIEGLSIRPWEEVDWVMHKKGKGQIDESIYIIDIDKKENLVREKITIPNSTFLMERSFERIGKDWYLVYCLEIFL